MDSKRNKILNISIIIIGTIFLLLSAFHTNIWFDESYSVSIANHNFAEIWKISSYDVHPIFYYWILRIINLIFGMNVYTYRLFSVLCITLTGILGYTHIRKDFGERVGILFSYLTFFLPAICIYAVEIRMYALALYLATILGIYAYRIVTKEFSKKNWIIFAISSLCLAYTHYYGLITAGIVNLVLFIYILIKKKEDKRYIKSFIIQAIIEVVLYLPWIVPFLYRSLKSSGGFWIKITFPNTLMELLNFQYNGTLGDPFTKKAIIALAFAVVLYGYIIIKEILQVRKEKRKLFNAGELAILIYLLVILGAWILSKKTEILYSRYLLVITGFLIFELAYFLSKEKVVVMAIIIVFLTGMSVYNEYHLVKENYASSNLEAINYMKENIQDGDIIIYNRINMAILNTYFPDNTQYFLNFGHWGIHEAYKAYAPSMKIVEDWNFLNDFYGRIWIMDSEDSTYVYDNIDKNIVETVGECKHFEAAYHGYKYDITLVEKK